MDRIAREIEKQRPGRGVTIDAALGRRSGEGVTSPITARGRAGRSAPKTRSPWPSAPRRRC